jgi:hypothetical protein
VSIMVAVVDALGNQNANGDEQLQADEDKST